jgi:hypothetical protein
MKIRIPVIIKDPEVAEYKDLPFWEEFTVEEDAFLDGPISRRIAILDFDESGRLSSGTPFKPPIDANSFGRYAYPSQDLHDQQSFSDWDFVRAAVFGGVYKALSMFEESDTLGRKVRWAFPGPQLLVIPRAGEWANAFYERDSRSLQLFYFSGNGKKTYTCHSQDIIGHETAHAIIDGIAPDLYDSITPESLAIHEALADVTTVLLAFRSRKLVMRVLELTNGNIDNSNAFTRVAEQFASAISQGRHDFLRNLKNDLSMMDTDVDRTEPHSLSRVLSGALYSVVAKLHEELKEEKDKKELKSKFITASEENRFQRDDTPSLPTYSWGKALFLASERLKRMIMRGLDYLPPGDATFADFGRAMLAADAASHPESSSQRDWMAEQFEKRKIISSQKSIEPNLDIDSKPLAGLDLNDLLESDWVAYQFVDKNRKWLGLPSRIPFEIRPRLRVKKRYYHREGNVEDVEELIMKIVWTESEKMSSGPGLPSLRRLRRGVSLAIDFNTKRVRALLCTRPPEEQAKSRDEFIRQLAQNDILRIGDAARGPDGNILRACVSADVMENVLRVKNTARMLHIIGGYENGR